MSSPHAKETLRGLFDIVDPDDAEAYLNELTGDLLDPDHPPKVRQLGRTLRRWAVQIVNWHRARVSNGLTEAVNNLIKQIKRTGFGFRRFTHYRLRVLLYLLGPPRRHRPGPDPISRNSCYSAPCGRSG